MRLSPSVSIVTGHMTEIVRLAAPQTSSFQRFVPAAQESRLEYLAQLCNLARHSATPGSSKRMTRMKYISYQRVPQRCATFAGNVTKLSTMRTRKPIHLIPSVSRPASTSTWSATTTERTRSRPFRTGWPAIPASTSTSPRILLDQPGRALVRLPHRPEDPPRRPQVRPGPWDRR